jgi:hypothetical protein
MVIGVFSWPDRCGTGREQSDDATGAVEFREETTCVTICHSKQERSSIPFAIRSSDNPPITHGKGILTGLSVLLPSRGGEHIDVVTGVRS